MLGPRALFFGPHQGRIMEHRWKCAILDNTNGKALLIDRCKITAETGVPRDLGRFFNLKWVFIELMTKIPPHPPCKIENAHFRYFKHINIIHKGFSHHAIYTHNLFFKVKKLRPTGKLWFKELHIANFSSSQDLNPVSLTQHLILSILPHCLIGNSETSSMLKWKMFFYSRTHDLWVLGSVVERIC